MFGKFPYTNFHELNLDYFINKFNEIFTEWEQLNSTLLEWKAATDASNALWKTSVENGLAAWKTATEADLNARETALRAELSAWKTATEADIGTWETDTLAALNAWKATAEATFETIRVQAAASATAAQTAQTAAETAQTAAETAQTAAETAAASVNASAAQIATNTGDISDLKTHLDNLPNEIASGLYNGCLFDWLQWENGWVNSNGNYEPNSQRYLTQTFSSENGQRVINDSESTIYIVYFTTFSSLSSFVYDSYIVVNSERYVDIDTTKPYFLIESLSETVQGLEGIKLQIPSIANYLSIENIQKIIKEKKQNAMAYVSNNAITWYNTADGTCYLTINNDIVIRTNYGTTSNNIIAQISVSDLLDTVENAGFTVTDGVISGTSFAIIFDFDDNTLKAMSPTNKEIFDNTLILFVHHYLSWTGGVLIDNPNNLKIKDLEVDIDENATNIDNLELYVKASRKQNAIAYVSGNAISWYNENLSCFLTISGDIVIRTNYGTTSNNIIAQISVSDLLDTVENAGFTVTDGVISGTSFAIIFDFDDNTLKAMSPTNKEIFDNTLILFVHHYPSWTGGELVINANFDDIKIIKNSIQGLDNSLTALDNKVEEISPTLPTFLEPETNACFDELVNTCDEKTIVIAFTTDNHYGASNGMNFPTTATSIKSINEKFPIDFVVDGGDLINGDKTKTEDITNISNAVRMLLNTGKTAYTLIGNHDDGSFTSTELPLLSKGELYALLERHSGINLDYVDRYEHFGYKDFDEFNIRVIFLDAMYGTNGHVSSQWGYSDDELAWFTANALNTNKQIVMFSHMAFTASFMAYGTSIKNGAEMRNAVESFIANGGIVVALFHGHNHWDYIGQYSQTNGFKEVSTGCGRIISGPDIPYAHPEGAVMPEREEGTITQELWDIITIKPMAREVKMIRYGAGNNRTFNY